MAAIRPTPSGRCFSSSTVAGLCAFGFNTALSKDQPHSGWLLKRLSLFVSASINIPFYRNYFTQSYFISVFSLVHLPLCYHHFSLILFPFRICFCKYFSLLWFYFLLILFLSIFPPTNILFVMSILSNSYILAPFSPL